MSPESPKIGLKRPALSADFVDGLTDGWTHISPPILRLKPENKHDEGYYIFYSQMGRGGMEDFRDLNRPPHI